ncbi:unnamed protein product [Diatraea saccharalis]|uniref:FP protein C-terminal domain-containing protein n=1 Tax=Diatraea saccharalis TaxID=40085 RepID=A0A9N9WDH1_9NEOP|nr:unnamed protein product [Diatraea saccharalis]
MAPGKLKCAGFLQIITDRQYLRCCVCSENFDLICANVSEQRFRSTLTGQHRANWKCEACKSKEPKADNSNTPIHGHGDKVSRRRGGVVLSPSEECVPVPSSENTDNKQWNMQLLIEEMRLFRKELQEIRREVQAFNETLGAIVTRVDLCEDRLDQLTSRMDKIECHHLEPNSSEVTLSCTIDALKAELNERDQELLMNDIEITCIPEQKGESLQHIMISLAKKIGVQLEQLDVVSAVRVGRSLDVSGGGAATRPRPIVVRLVRRAVRDELLHAARVRRGATTEGLDLPGPPRRFYINERLTRTNRLLFRQAREIGERSVWRFVWTKDGKVYSRKHAGQGVPRQRLRTQKDLIRVFCPEAVGSSQA